MQVPTSRQEVMNLVDEEPVRAPGARAQRLQPREELGEEVRRSRSGMPSRFTTT